MTTPVGEKLRKAFQRLGLTEYEMKAYLALLQHGEMTANQVSEAAEIPYSKVYEVLESLEEKGWIGSEGGRPARYHARSISTALEISRMRIERDLKRIENFLLSELSPIAKGLGTREKHDVWILRGELNILSKLKSLLDGCDSELQLATPWMSKEIFTMLLPTLTTLKARNGRAQIMLSSDCNRAIAMRLKEYGEVRLRDQLFGGGAIADSDETIIILGEEGRSPTLAIWSDHAGLARIAKVYFEHLWRDSEPLK
ncbi:MAG: TrmB family transcriptional regulator [Thaumarchaeota archaeon]|jgi:sugar-specific transcriptional regulator TrmB|nr:TrmB family transcriptional regulator [Candidatus Wolframiiraptor allenii]